MGRRYRQLSEAERERIAELHGAGRSTRQIAAALDRSSSTIAAELKRNARSDGSYDPAYAQERTWARRFRGSKLDGDDALRERVTALLAQGLSPEQAAGRLNREAGRTLVCHETIYQFIYAQVRRTKDYAWARLPPSGRGRRRARGQRRPRDERAVGAIRRRRPLSERPHEAQTRAQPGHWEADLMHFGRGGRSLLVLQERRSRALLALPLAGKAAAPLSEALSGLLAALPAPLRRSVAFDNGAEFARHYELHALGVEPFFCEPHSAWQKGGVENAIGRLRRVLPRRAQLAELPRRLLNEILQAANNTPRKCLDFQTPAEVLRAQLSGLQLESTFQRALERRRAAREHQRSLPAATPRVCVNAP